LEKGIRLKRGVSHHHKSVTTTQSSDPTILCSA